MVAMDIVNIYENYNKYFNSDYNYHYKAIFEKCSNIAYKTGYKLYLIGGLVRDLLLNEKSLDIDITVAGDAVEFAHILEKELNAEILSIHKSFGTVKVKIDGEKIDFASTRSESYPRAGHLPVVTKIGCSLNEDVLRRDFTINSLAMSLNKENFADLIDYVNGYSDLNAGIIKILHNKSFIDDPTRIIRALKYSSRLGFDLDNETLNLQNEYLKNINYDMCYKRVKNEIKKTFDKCNPEAFNKFISQGIYKLITSNQNNALNSKAFDLINTNHPKHPWLIYLGTIAVFEDDNFLDKLELTKNEKNIILDAKKLISSKLNNDFLIYKAFSTLKIESLLLLAILGKEKEVIHYLSNLSKIKITTNGSDLIKLGFNPSKKFSLAFDYLLKKKIQTPKITKQEELEIIQKFLNENK